MESDVIEWKISEFIDAMYRITLESLLLNVTSVSSNVFMNRITASSMLLNEATKKSFRLML